MGFIFKMVVGEALYSYFNLVANKPSYSRFVILRRWIFSESY